MNVLILHNRPADDALADEQDVLDQVAAVRDALESNGHRVGALSCTLDLAAARTDILEMKPDVVFNLVESLERTDRLAPLATLLLEAMNIPFTGSGTTALITAGGKLTTKRILRATALPTADWTSAGEPGLDEWLDLAGTRVIVKPVWEHASFGMDDGAVFDAVDSARLNETLYERERRTGRPWFAERFIEGREFNLSLLQKSAADIEPLVLPPAEIEFVNFPENKPRIVGHGAKWDAQSPEYHQTPRRFDFGADDAPLLDRMNCLAIACWSTFNLRGYARVDFRVDEAGQPWILEVNANPCLTPDAGLAAAARQAGMDYPALIGRILACLPFDASTTTSSR